MGTTILHLFYHHTPDPNDEFNVLHNSQLNQTALLRPQPRKRASFGQLHRQPVDGSSQCAAMNKGNCGRKSRSVHRRPARRTNAVRHTAKQQSGAVRSHKAVENNRPARREEPRRGPAHQARSNLYANVERDLSFARPSTSDESHRETEATSRSHSLID